MKTALRFIGSRNRFSGRYNTMGVDLRWAASWKPMKKVLFYLLCGSGLWLSLHTPAHAQNKTPTKAPQSTCMVAEFRSLALLTHDANERVSKTNDWLKQNGEKCTQAQLNAIASNSPTWLGTALTIEVAGRIDALIEAKIADNPDLMAALYSSKGKEARASVEVTKPPPAPAPVVPAAQPALAQANTVIQPVMVQGPGAGMNDRPRTAEVPDAYFGTRQKEQLLEFFEETRGPGECPKGLVKRGDKCESRVKERDWKLRQPLPPSERPEDLPMALILKLGQPAPDHQYKRVGADILLLKGPQNIVVDAILDLGGLKAKAGG